MLVIISDLHLTDGTVGATLPRGAFEIFAQQLREMALRAGWRGDNTYVPIEQIDLLLLGDVLDFIRSRRWADASVRPWDDPQGRDLVETASKIARDIFQHNAGSLRLLRTLASGGAISVPPSGASGEPAWEAPLCAVPVRIHYMVGNHDWFLHLPGSNYNLLRQQVAHHLGLSNRHSAPFPHEPTECEELLETMRRHRVWARHGAVFDPINFTGERDASSLGDAIVIELVSRFTTAINDQLADDLPAAALRGFAEIDNIRPLVMTPVWIEGLLERTGTVPSVRKKVKQIWDTLADEFLELPFVRQQDTWCPFEVVDGLERALKFSRRLSLGGASRIASWLHQLRGASNDSYYEHALAEPDFRNRRARHIVYGHTHLAESVPLDASFADGYVLDQMYFNSGSWRRVYRPTCLAQGEHEFIPYDTMTFLSFFQGDERCGRSFETWTGTLASPTDTHAHRTDVVEEQDAGTQSVSPPNVHIGPPHFAVSPSRRRADLHR